MPRKKKVDPRQDEFLEIDKLGKPEPQDYHKGWERIKFSLKCKNEKQKECTKLIRDNNITFIQGPSGTGKSYIALATAVELLKDPKTPYKKLVLMIAPIQGSIEVGFIKGSIDAKLAPFEQAYLYNLADMIGMEAVQKLKEGGYIETICVSFARGMNLKDCVCICGECQQYDKESFLTLITRVGETCNMIFEGDTYQCDNKSVKKGQSQSGLKHAISCLSDIPGIGFIEFNKTHIVRNPIISKILAKWDPSVYGFLDDDKDKEA